MVAEPCLSAERRPPPVESRTRTWSEIDPDLGGAGGDGAVDGGPQGVGGRDVQLSRDREDGAVSDPHLANVDGRSTILDVQLPRLRNHGIKSTERPADRTRLRR